MQQQNICKQLTTKEYIYNLQQQIYFLELQNKLLKDKLNITSGSIQENCNSTFQIDSQKGNQNLTVLFDQLQQQYNKLKAEKDEISKQFNQEISKLKKELGGIYYIKNENEELKNNKYKQLIDTENIYQNQIKELQNQIQQLKQQLTDKNLQIQLLTDQNNNLNQYYEQQQREVTLTRQQNIELSSQLKIVQVTSDETLQTQNAELKIRFNDQININQSLQNKLSSAQTELQETKTNAQQVQQKADLAILESQQLKGQCKMLDEMNKAFQQQISQLRNEKQQQNIKIEELQAEILRLSELHQNTEDLISAYKNKDLIDELKQLNTQLQNEINKQNETYLKADTKIQEAQNQAEIRQAKINQLEEQLTSLKNDNIKLSTEVQSIKLINDSIKQQITKLREQYQQLQQLNMELTKENIYLQQEASVKEELSQIKIEEFQQLANTNRKLYEKLQNLTNKFSKCGSAVKNYVDVLPPEKKVVRQAYLDKVDQDE